MDKIKLFLKNHQQVIVLTIGYLIVASLGFGLGRLSIQTSKAPEIRVEEAFAVPQTGLNNYTPNVSGTQTTTQTNTSLTCSGQIKGSSSMIYHLPGGAFYERTTSPIRCFDTEADAKAAGFRRSSK